MNKFRLHPGDTDGTNRNVTPLCLLRIISSSVVGNLKALLIMMCNVMTGYSVTGKCAYCFTACFWYTNIV